MPNRYLHIVCSILCGVALAFLSGCEHRYWFRHKMKMERRKTIHLYTVNHSPAFISRQFENAVQQVCAHALSKKGYQVVKDTPEYYFIVHIKVDSFYIQNIRHFQNGYNIFRPIYANYYYDNNVKELSLEYELLNPQSELRFWESKSEFFYFDNEGRDLRRSRSMINYAIRHTPE